MPTSWPAHCMALGTSLSFMKPPNEGSEVIPNICTPFSLPFIRFQKCSLGGELTRVTSHVFGQFHPKLSSQTPRPIPQKEEGLTQVSISHQDSTGRLRERHVVASPHSRPLLKTTAAMVAACEPCPQIAGLTGHF